MIYNEEFFVVVVTEENKLTHFWLKKGVKPELETSRVLMETKTADTSFSNWMKIKVLYNTVEIKRRKYTIH